MENRNTWHEYWKSIESIATEIKDEWLDDNDIDIYQFVCENVDNSEWIMYYSENFYVLQHSKNEDAMEDQGLELDTSKGWRNIVNQIAHYAMEQDVQDKLSDLGWNGDVFEAV